MTEKNWKNRITGYGEESPDQLLANPHNHRIHPKRQQDALGGSLDTLGYIQTVIVNRATGHIVDGHLRVTMALREGQKSIPVTYVELTEEEEAQALLSLDPIAAMAATDKDKVDELLRMVNTDNEQVMKHLSDFAAENKLDWGQPEQVDAEPQIDRAAELQEKWNCHDGQLWVLGNHRLMCGDCTSVENVNRLLDGKKVNMVLTDPPYGMNLDADFSDMVGIGAGNKYDKVDGDDADYDPSFIFDLFGYCKEIFLWGADYYAERIPNRNDGSWIVWDKMSGGDGVNDNYDKMFGSNFELCWSKQKHKRALARVLWKGIFGLSEEPGKKRYHPTQKPVKLYDWFLEKFSKENDIVVDLYAGVGSLVISCENHRISARVMERDPKYCAVIIQRWVDVTGLQPVLSDL